MSTIDPILALPDVDGLTLEEVQALPPTGFILWAVTTYGWNVDDFRRHFDSDFPIELYADILSQHGLLTVDSPQFRLTELGITLLGQLIGNEASLQEEAFNDEAQLLSSSVEPSLMTDASAHRNSSIIPKMAEPSLVLDWTHFLPDPRESPHDLNALLMPDNFTGRLDELDWLRNVLSRTASRRTNAPICGLYGIDGIGKTSLAAAATRLFALEGTFPDGIAAVWCDHSHTTEQRLTPAQILETALTQLNLGRSKRGSAVIPELANTVRRHLAGRKVLVVLDHLDPLVRFEGSMWGIEEVVRILHQAGAALLLISEQCFPSHIVPQVAQRQVGPLADPEALALFSTMIGRTDAHPLRQDELQVARRIIRAVDHHTLAVKLISRYLAQKRDLLSTVADDLSWDPRHVFDLTKSVVSGSELTLREVIEASVEALKPSVKHLFVALAAFETVEFSRSAVEALGTALRLSQDVREFVDTLVAQGVVESDTIATMPQTSDRDRLRIHALMQDFARRKFEEWPQAERNIAKRAIAKYYADYTMRLPAADLEAAASMDKENIVGAIEWANENRQHRLVLELCYTMRTFWYNRWFTEACKTYLPLGIQAGEYLLLHADNEDVLSLLTEVQYTLAQVHRRLGNLSVAQAYLEANRSWRRMLGDLRGEAAVDTELAVVARIKGDLATSQRYLQTSMRTRTALRDFSGLSHVWSQEGRIKMWQCAPVAAKRLINQSLSLAQRIQDKKTEADDLTYLGQIDRMQGSLGTAEARLREALAIHKDVGDLRGQAVALHQLGQVLRIRGNLSQAQKCFEANRRIRRDIEDRRGEGEAVGYLARIAREQGRLEQAVELFHESLEIAKEVGDKRGQAIVISQLGRIAWAQGDLRAAEQYFQQSISIREEVGDRRGVGADYGYLGRIALLKGDEKRADELLGNSLQLAQEVRDRQGEANVCVALGVLAALRGDTKQAERYLSKGRKIAEAIPSKLDTARCLWELGRFYLEHAANPDRGRELASRSLAEFEKLGIRAEDICGRDIHSEAMKLGVI